jgi:hypothetical protein
MPLMPGIPYDSHYLGETQIIDRSGKIAARMKQEEGERLNRGGYHPGEGRPLAPVHSVLLDSLPSRSVPYGMALSEHVWKVVLRAVQEVLEPGEPLMTRRSVHRGKTSPQSPPDIVSAQAALGMFGKSQASGCRGARPHAIRAASQRSLGFPLTQEASNSRHTEERLS